MSLRYIWNVILLFTTVFCFAQEKVIQIDTSLSVEQLVREIFVNANCTDISNITFYGDDLQIGHFTNGDSSISISEGIVLSSGSVLYATGPNDSTNTSTPFNNFSPDPLGDLERLANVIIGGVVDRAILEFDFRPIDNMLSFEFVFASEEYCDFVNTQRNDVFGFFLSGPGISGIFGNSAENIALIPGSGEYISINNVNHQKNTTYFIDNTPISQIQFPNQIRNCDFLTPIDGHISVLELEGSAINNIEYDGFTTVLRAEYPVQANELYHIKIAVSDILDGTFDSSVFLKAGSFSLGQPRAILEIPDTLTCQHTQIMLDGSNSTFDSRFTFEWATENGHFVSGTNSLTPVIDSAGLYHLIVSRNGMICNDTASVEVVLKGDFPIIEISQPDTISCMYTTVELNPDVTYAGDLEYQWILPSGSQTVPGPDKMLVSGEHGRYTLIARDPQTGCSSNEFFDVILDTITSPINIPVPAAIDCNNPEITIEAIITGNWDSLDFEWSSIGGNILTDRKARSIRVNRGGSYTIRVRNVNNGCDRFQSTDVLDQSDRPDIETSGSSVVSCGVDSTFQVTLLSPVNAPEYRWYTASQTISTQQTFVTDQPGFYYIEVKDGLSGCIALDTLQLEWLDIPPELEISNNPEINCAFDPVQITATYSGGSADIQWSTDVGNILGISADSLTATINAGGTYYCLAQLKRGNCFSTDSVIVSAPLNELQAVAGEDVTLDCPDSPVISGSASNATAHTTFSWKHQESGNIFNEMEISPDAAGNYILELKDSISGCISLDTLLVRAKPQIGTLAYEVAYKNCQLDDPILIFDPTQQISFGILLNGIMYSPGDSITSWNDSISTLFIIDSLNCMHTIDIQEDKPNPLEVSILANDTVEIGDQLVLDHESNRSTLDIQSFEWTPEELVACANCPKTLSDLQLSQVFKLQIADKFGCIAQDTAFVFVYFPIRIFIPNSFSPNNDNVNDHFTAYFNEYITRIESMKIFDRWGSCVFSRELDSVSEEDTIISWNGQVAEKEASPGNYIYLIRLKTVESKTLTYQGEFLLLR